MKALSIQQPWAWLIVNGIKDIENRDWMTDYRGFLLIHAGKKLDTGVLSKNGYLNRYYLGIDPHWQAAVASMPDRTADYETGGIIGYATLKDVVTKSDSPWFRGKYGFVLSQRHTVPFIPLRGQPALFDVPAEIEAEINAIRDERAWAEDMRDMEQIRREWRAYRDEGLGNGP